MIKSNPVSLSVLWSNSRTRILIIDYGWNIKNLDRMRIINYAGLILISSKSNVAMTWADVVAKLSGRQDLIARKTCLKNAWDVLTAYLKSIQQKTEQG